MSRITDSHQRRSRIATFHLKCLVPFLTPFLGAQQAAPWSWAGVSGCPTPWLSACMTRSHITGSVQWAFSTLSVREVTNRPWHLAICQFAGTPVWLCQIGARNTLSRSVWPNLVHTAQHPPSVWIGNILSIVVPVVTLIKGRRGSLVDSRGLYALLHYLIYL